MYGRRFWVLGFLLAALATTGCRDDPQTASADEPQSFSASSDTTIPVAVGQWVRYRHTAADGTTFEELRQVVAEEDGAFWVEMIHGETRARQLMDFGRLREEGYPLADSGNIEKLVEFAPEDIRRSIIWQGDQRIELPPEVARGLPGVGAGLVDSMTADFERLGTENVEVPAGDFPDCYKDRRQVNFGLGKMTTTTWLHASVPLGAVVRQETSGASNEALGGLLPGMAMGSTVELIGFGLSGARSQLD